MLQRIMAFQIQAQQQQQQRPAMMHPQQVGALQAAQRGAAAPKARGGAKQPKQPKQSKAAAQKAAAAAAAQPDSDGTAAGQDVGGEQEWRRTHHGCGARVLKDISQVCIFSFSPWPSAGTYWIYKHLPFITQNHHFLDAMQCL